VDVARFKKLPIVGILRLSRTAPVDELVDAAVSSGLETIEIAMNSPNAESLIRRAVSASRGRLAVGAGTVMDEKILKSALSAGATFIVLPVLVKEVVGSCVAKKIPVFPGAFTPGEIHAAWNAGATMVKVFPSGVLGPSYIREIKAPFADIELMACGGVTPDNIGEYFSSGASAVAFGASVFRGEWLEKKDFASVERAIKALVDRSRAAYISK
jgi:2-dehydro-3-deoxyphosphogluconate aldolase/(4S)-4-hydroxy-2-oxoglutarate aldolase